MSLALLLSIIHHNTQRYLKQVNNTNNSLFSFYSIFLRRFICNNRLFIVRDTFNHFGFGSPSKPFRSTVTDYNEPLIIWFGEDSWQNIGVGPTNSERIALTYGEQIPQINVDVDSNTNLPNNPAKDVDFREAVIDEMRAQKDEELLRWIKDNEFRNKFQAIETTN